MLAGGKREREREGGKFIHPLHPCIRVPEWNSLCWLVDRETERKGRRKTAL
jgi:hypothetical protein